MSPTLLRLRDLIKAGLAWWLRELTALLPARLVEALAGERDQLIIDVAPRQVIVRRRLGDQVREIARVPVLESGPPARPAALTNLVARRQPRTIVRLAPEVAVRKLVQLPDTAAASLRQILEHQLERHTPIAPEQLYFDYAVRHHDRAQKRLSIELVMVLRATIEAAGRLVRDWGFAPHTIGLIEPTTWQAELDFAPHRDSVTRSRAKRRRFALAGLAAILLCGGAYATLDHAQRQADALSTAVAQAKTQALAAGRVRAEIVKRLEQRDFLTIKRLETPRLAVLTEIARALGDDVWLTDLQLAGTKLRAGGFAQSASGLIPLFQQLPGFANPRFESPVTRAVTGVGERFDLSVEIHALQPPPR